MAIYLYRVLRNEALIVIGQKFGMSGNSPAGSAVERVKNRIATDEKFEKVVTCLQEVIVLPKSS